MSELSFPRDPSHPWQDAVLSLVAQTPSSREAWRLPAERAQRAAALSDQAAAKAAVLAGGLALPPGPLGWLSILPELMAVWRIQAQLVADIAALHGHSAELGREQMLYCLFRHTAAQALRDLAVRGAERATSALLQRVAGAIGVRLSQRGLASGVARWVPVLGAAGVGAYAWWDTSQVGRTAAAFFADLPQVTVAPLD